MSRKRKTPLLILGKNTFGLRLGLERFFQQKRIDWRLALPRVIARAATRLDKPQSGVKRAGRVVIFGHFQKEPRCTALAKRCFQRAQNPAAQAAALCGGRGCDGQKLCLFSDHAAKREGLPVFGEDHVGASQKLGEFIASPRPALACKGLCIYRGQTLRRHRRGFWAGCRAQGRHRQAANKEVRAR